MTLALAIVVFVGFLIEAAIGFGATLVTVTLGAMWMPIDRILPAFIPLNLVMSAYLALRHRQHIAARVLFGRVVPLMGLGLPLGMLLFHRLGSAPLIRVFGVFVVALAAIELWRSTRPQPAGPSPIRDAGLLVLGGVVHGLFATGGPLAVYVLGRELHDKSAFRATLAGLWSVLNVVVLIGYAIGGKLDRQSAELTLWLALPLALGMIAGERLHHAIPAAQFRRAVFALLLVAGAALIAR